MPHCSAIKKHELVICALTIVSKTSSENCRTLTHISPSKPPALRDLTNFSVASSSLSLCTQDHHGPTITMPA